MSAEELKAKIAEQDEEIQRLKKLLSKSKSKEQNSSLKCVTHFENEDSTKHVEAVTKLSNEDISRYSRQLILPELGVKGQINLKNSAVLIVGAGGLGCPAAIYLAAAGIGRLGVVDYDEVELSNLHRQILHTMNSIGVPKALSVAESCSKVNPGVNYVPYQLQLRSSNALDIVRQYDVVLDATDNVATRYLLNDACVLAGKPLVSGSALRFEGQLTVYNSDGGPCYRCLFPQPPPPETVTNCSEGGVVGVVPGIIGSLQALEAIKIASGIGASFQQRLLLFDALDGAFRSVKLRPRSKDCAVCGNKPTVRQLVDYEQFCGARATDKDQEMQLLEESSRISAKDYSAMLSNKVPHVLVDVRPSVEMDICQLPHPAINIPVSMFNKKNSDVASQISHAIKDISNKVSHQNPSSEEKIPVICVCRRGNDSQLAVQKLLNEMRDSAVKVMDIRGGLWSWAKQVDSEFPTY